MAQFPSTLRPERDANFSPPSSASVMKAWSFSSVYSYIRSEQLYYCHSSSLLFLYLNMLSAAKRAEVELLGYWLDGPGFEFRYEQMIASPKCLSGCGGYFLDVQRLEGETQNWLQFSATLRMCGAVPPIPYMSWCHPNGLWQGEVREGKKQRWEEGRKEEGKKGG